MSTNRRKQKAFNRFQKRPHHEIGVWKPMYKPGRGWVYGTVFHIWKYKGERYRMIAWKELVDKEGCVLKGGNK